MNTSVERLDQSPGTRAALADLAGRDADLARAIQLGGPLPDRRRPPGFATLAKIVMQQQLSLASAAAIWGRFEAAAAPFTPANVLALSEPDLRAVGLSRQKADFAHALARAVEGGRLDLDRLAEMDDDAALAHLCDVRGIGRWTAEVYLLFALDRSDIWPAGDLAVQAALQHLKGWDARLRGKPAITVADPWRPHRGVAARVLWQYYRVIKGRAAGVGQ